jgi:hypothetical protein
VNALGRTTGSEFVFPQLYVFIGDAIVAIGGVVMLFVFKCFVEKEFKELNRN